MKQNDNPSDKFNTIYRYKPWEEMVEASLKEKEKFIQPMINEQSKLLNPSPPGLSLAAKKSPNTTARKAYELCDTEASKSYHDSTSNSSVEKHQKDGGYLKPILLGGLDGILTSFAIVAGATGGSLPTKTIIILGVSNIIADAFSMGVGQFLSSQAENEWILSEKQREEWEMKHYKQGEINEMIDLYVQKGMNRDDAKNVITTMAKYEEFFVNIMMKEELELQVPSDNYTKESLIEGFVMFCSFVTFGCLPLLGYVLLPFFYEPRKLSDHDFFVGTCFITGIVLFSMGCLKSTFSVLHWLKCGCETFLLGGVCALVAYTIGLYVEHIMRYN